VRFLADYQRVEVTVCHRRNRLRRGRAHPTGGAQIGQDLNIWSFRTQYAF
jgi:phosphate-selective porin OprO/OprP